MKLPLKKMLEKLNVPREMGAYETQPWAAYDAEEGKTCSAEVRMSPDADELEAEIQIMYDEPPENVPMMQQFCSIFLRPGTSGDWEVKTLRIKGKPLEKDIYNWQEKCCNFFRAVTQSLAMDEIPDLDDLMEKEMHNRDKGGQHGGEGGGKAPKVQGNSLLGNKKGGF